MSVIPLKADIRQRIEHVCLVPIADILAAWITSRSPRYLARCWSHDLTRLILGMSLSLSAGTQADKLKDMPNMSRVKSCDQQRARYLGDLLVIHAARMSAIGTKQTCSMR